METGRWSLPAGGCAFNAEPMAPFFDVMVIGDGETALVDLLNAVAKGREAGVSRLELLHALTAIPGVYIPEFFDYDPETGVKPLVAGYGQVVKAVVADLDTAPFPSCQVVPFAQAVHDRLSVEIARGCTRGCRFCHAGMIYRPVRERSLETLEKLVGEGLGRTGYEELSFLSLSTGDFSALESLFAQSIDRCRRDQIAVSLPSLRAGTLSDSILSMMAGIRRTGATLAPEAATQRLRDVINKGITEDDILSHAKRLFEHGWQQVKLYFMIGLPTETEDDVRGIFELAQKVLAQAPRGAKRLQVTAAISPFVPKPHTPFQWDPQITLEQIRGRVNFLRELFATERRLTLRWHEPEMSFLEGVFARGGRELAPIVEAGWRKGALFCSWIDRFDLAPWLEVFAEAGLEPADWLAGRDPDKPLPWDHLSCGVSPAYLRLERSRALEGTVTGDCRYGACTGCGCVQRGRPQKPARRRRPHHASLEQARPRVRGRGRAAGAAQGRSDPQGRSFPGLVRQNRQRRVLKPVGAWPGHRNGRCAGPGSSPVFPPATTRCLLFPSVGPCRWACRARPNGWASSCAKPFPRKILPPGSIPICLKGWPWSGSRNWPAGARWPIRCWRPSN